MNEQEWITAADALRLLTPVFGEYAAKLTICRRAHAGLVRARTEHFMIDDLSKGQCELPEEFWWAEGHAALKQDWTIGDFETWNKHRIRFRAFSVSFFRADIEKLIPSAKTPQPPQGPVETAHTKANRNEFEWDVFISHASEDKDDFVRPLADSLRRCGLRVWFDEFTLTVGDGLRRSIDQGLAKSRYGIVVVSPNFLQKEWPQKELDGLAALEIDGVKVILPVWHKITAKEIRACSPMLADRLAALSSKGIEHVTGELLRAIQKRS